MRTISSVFAVFFLVFVFTSMCSSGAPVSMPDGALEAAVEARIGDNTIPGTVDSDWLSGQDGAAGPYTGDAGGLTVLGLEGDTLFTVSGVCDLTGLEHAHHLTVLFLRESPLHSLAPIIHLTSLTTLAFNACGLKERHFQELLEADFSLDSFALVNTSDSMELQNQIRNEQVVALVKAHPFLKRLGLVNLGLVLDIASLSGTPSLADPPCRKELYISGNEIESFSELSLFYDAVLLELASCGITDMQLAQADWSRFVCLSKTLNLSHNEITVIEPLLGLIRARFSPEHADSPSVTLDLRGNRLNEVSILKHIPALREAGYDVLFDMELALTVEGSGELSAGAGSTWHSLGASVFRRTSPRPDSGQGFVGWQGDIVSDGYAVTVEMDKHRDLAAVFSETPAPGRVFYRLSIVSSGLGSGSILPGSGERLYRDGDTIELSATPAAGSYFGGWKIDASCNAVMHSNRKSYWYKPALAVEMNCDVNVAAHFETAGHILNLSLSGEGSLSLLPGRYPFVHGAVIELQVFPVPGWRLQHWEDGQGHILYAPEGDDDPTYHVTLAEDQSVCAIFEKAVRSLTIYSDEALGAFGSTVPAGGTAGQQYFYSYGDMAKITAFPGSRDSAFAGWSGEVSDDVVPDLLLTPELVLPMTKDRKITAAFVPAETWLVVDAALDGIPWDAEEALMSPAPGTYGFVRDSDNRVVLHAPLLPDSAPAFTGWFGDLQGNSRSSDFTEIVTMDRDREITAAFQTQNVYKLTVTQRGAGSVTPAPGVYSMVPGRQLIFHALPRGTECFGGWRVRYQDGTDRALITPEFPLEITGDIEVTAHFGIPRYTIWIGAMQEGGLLTPPAGVYRVPEQTVLDLNATPPADSIFYHWLIGDNTVISRDPLVRVTVEEDSAFNAVFWDPGYRVQTQICGTGSGSVAVLPDMAGEHPASSVVEFCARPDSDSVFVCWEGVPEGIDVTTPTLKITLQQDIIIAAVFAKMDYHMTVLVDGLPDGIPAKITPSPGIHGYLEGDEVMIFAAPPPGSGLAFAGWEEAESLDINSGTTLLMDQDRVVTARFVPAASIDSVEVTVLPSEGDGEGILHPLIPGVYHFSRGAALIFSCDLQNDSYFGGFTGTVVGKINYHELPVVLEKDTTVGARFTRTGTLLTLGLNGEEGGRISFPMGTYRLSYDLDIELTATRTNTQWVFRGWYDAQGKQILPYGQYRFRTSSESPERTVIALFHRYNETMPMEYCWLR
ncbi:MAG: hypothetical protein KAH38_11430 [Candidatus Hydrogenedentes bacterium]|nr:hypothetical protein [Candidatus Hydrogenedentota bacterium]